MIFLGPHKVKNERGVAVLEVSIAIMLFLFLAFGIIEYGSIINERNAVTQIAREGASLASRDLTTNANMLDLLESTEGSLNLPSNQDHFKIFLAQIRNTPGSPPTCQVQERGNLSAGEVHSPDENAPQCELTDDLFTHLSTGNVDQFTVVKVYWEHEPITPVGGLTWFGGGGRGNANTVMMSRAIF